MRKRNRNARESKLDTAGAARSWLEQGIQPVPLQPRSKKPAGGKGWNTLKVTDRTVRQFFERGQNLGGLWGEPSDWIVDVDLDWDEAADFAEHYLPETFTYGRRTRPETHYLYRCKGAMTQAWAVKISDKNHPKGRTVKIVELRSSGSQSVLPPSLHPEGDRYEINNDISFRQITKAELERYLARIAAAAILIRSFPGAGARHDFIHALTGALMWSGWNAEETQEFMYAFLETVRDQDDDPKDRKITVRNTMEHFEKGDRIAGWRTLAQWIDPESLRMTRLWLAPPKKFKTPPKAVDEDSKILIPEFDPALLKVPGLVGDVAKWASRRSYLKQPAFDLSVGLMCTALASCNKYVIEGWSTPLQPYLMLLAPTAAGKGSALDSVFQFSANIKLGDLVFQGFQSYYALLDKLGEPPNMACWLWDEAARRLKSTRNPSSFDYQVVTWLLALYGRANSHVPAFPGRKTEIPALERPWLSLFAAAQPDQLIDSVTVSDLAMGLLNRFILFDSGDATPEANLERTEIFPSVIRSKAKQLKEFEPKKFPYEIGFESPHVWALFRDFDEEARRHASEEGESEIWGRANQNALMAAGIVSVGINPSRPIISESIAAWSLSLVRWGIACWAARIGDSTARTFREKESKAVERYIRSAHRYLHKARGAHRDLVKRGLMPFPVLQKLCRHLQMREFSEILDQLVEAELIGTGEEEGVECYWPIR